MAYVKMRTYSETDYGQYVSYGLDVIGTDGERKGFPMKYVKAAAEQIRFDRFQDFMTYSPGAAGKAAAEEAALAIAREEYCKNDNWGAAVVTSSYNTATGEWDVTVVVTNPAGNNEQTYVISV